MSRQVGEAPEGSRVQLQVGSFLWQSCQLKNKIKMKMDSSRALLAQRKTSSQDPIGTTWLKKRRLGKCSMRLFCTSYRFLTKRSDSLFNQRQIHHALSCTSEPRSLSIMINFPRWPLWQRKGERLRLKWLWGSQDFIYSSPRSCFPSTFFVLHVYIVKSIMVTN